MATPDLVSMVGQQAGRLVQILNESLHIANDSKSVKTRVSRLSLAKEKLAELRTLAQQHPFVSLTNLAGVLKCIEDLEREIDAQLRSNTAKPRTRREVAEEPILSAAAATTRLRDLPLAVIDLETTGLSARSGARIVEIAIVRVEPGKAPRIALDTLVDPQGPVRCTDIHGISDDDVVGAPVFADIVADAVGAMEGALVGAFNASFDMSFFRAEVGSAPEARGLRAPPPHVCLMWLRPLLKLGKRCSLPAACDDHGVRPGDHRAAGDALACALMWPHYVAAAEREGIVTVADLAAAGSHKYLSTLQYPFYGQDDVRDAGGRPRPTLKPRSPNDAAPFAGLRSYWHALVDSLLDGTLADSELAALRDLQESLGLSREQIRSVHARVYAERLLGVAEDDALTDQEVAVLSSLRAELGAIGWAP